MGLVAGGLGTYWPQFPNLLPQLQESARYVVERFTEMDAEVTDVGFISDAPEGAAAAEKLRQADCDLIVLFLTTYLTSSMVLPIAQRANTPVLVVRGETSRLLSRETVTEMQRRHAKCAVIEAEGQGHAPLLHLDQLAGDIAAFLMD